MALMMGKIARLCSAILLLLVNANLNAGKVGPVIYEAYVDEIVRAFAMEMRHNFGLLWIGDGGRMSDDVEEVEVIFHARRKTSIEEARELEVRATERLVEMINAHEKIRPFLREYPFTANRADVSISFVKRDHTAYTDGTVAFVYQARNKIFYRKKDTKTNQLLLLLEEPYEEALNKVQHSPPTKGISPRSELF